MEKSEKCLQNGSENEKHIPSPSGLRSFKGMVCQRLCLDAI